MFDGTYDASTKRAYFVLARTPLEKGADPDRASHCLPAGPILVALDTTNDQFVDLNGDAGGVALSLLGENPTAFVPDLANRRLFLVDAGCYVAPDGGTGEAGADAQASYERRGRGIEEVSLESLTSKWRYQHMSPQRLSGLVWVDDAHAYVSLDDGPPAFTTRWYALNTDPMTLGGEVKDFPLYAPRRVGSHVLGIATVNLDGSTSNALVEFDPASGEATTLVGDIFGDARFSAAYTGWAPIP